MWHSAATLDTDTNEQLVPSTPVTHLYLKANNAIEKPKVLKCTLKVLENRSTFEMYLSTSTSTEDFPEMYLSTF